MSQVLVNPYANKQAIAWSVQSASIEMTGGVTALDSSKETSILAAVEALSITYSRDVTPRYPLNSGNPIKLIGVPQGSLQLTTIIGPAHVVDTFLQNFGSTCKPFSLTVKTSSRQAEKGCEGANVPQTIFLTGCIGQSLSYQLSSSGGLVIAQGTFTAVFDGMDWKSA